MTTIPNPQVAFPQYRTHGYDQVPICDPWHTYLGWKWPSRIQRILLPSPPPMPLAACSPAIRGGCIPLSTWHKVL